MVDPIKDDQPASEAGSQVRSTEERPQPRLQESDRQIEEENKSDAAEQRLPEVTDVKIVKDVEIFQDQNAPEDNGTSQSSGRRYMRPQQDSVRIHQMPTEGRSLGPGAQKLQADSPSAREQDDELPKTKKKQALQDKKMTTINK